MMTLKPPKSPKPLAPPSPIKITTMASHHKKFPSTPSLSRQTYLAGLPQVNLTPHVSIDTTMNNFEICPPKICPKKSPLWKAFFGQNSPHTLWGEDTMKSLSFFLTSQ